MKNMKNQKGAVSLFVLLSMTFFVVFILGAYTLVTRRAQTQTMTLTELQSIYKTDSENLITQRYATKDEIIPVYNAEQFLLIGSNQYIEINDKIYKFGANEDGTDDNYSYILKGNIIIDIDKYFSQDLADIDFLEEKFYSDNYKIDKAEYDLYYYKATTDKSEKAYWKVALYQNTEKELFTEAEKTAIDTTSVNEEFRYSILDKITSQKTEYKYSDKFEFLLLYNEGITGNFNTTERFNWWKQIDSPLNLKEANALTSTTENIVKAPGYEAVEVKFTNNLWGGLVLSSSSASILDGATYNEQNNYSVGTISKYDNGTSADNTDDGIKGFAEAACSRCYLFVRVSI